MDLNIPLAHRVRPQTLDEFIGQEEILGKDKILYRTIKADRLSSIILWGPTGSGKTSLAKVISNTTKYKFIKLNAVTSGVGDIKSAIEEAKNPLLNPTGKCILFIDEIHRFNKLQQDALLPFVENGTVILIGATTENPYFEVNKALISRSMVFKLKPLSVESIFTILKNAIKNPRTIDMNLTDAQQARRVLDRIVGYKISPVLWKKVQKGLSAGRVQSVAVKLVVDREEEIEKFVPEEYWNIYATLATKKPKKSFEAKFYGKNDKKLDIHSKEEIDKILDELEKAKYVVSEIKKGEKKRNPAPPFTTSTMQQEASRKLNFALRKTMQVAQRII